MTEDPKEVECTACLHYFHVNNIDKIETLTKIIRIITCPKCNESYAEQGSVWRSTRAVRSLRIVSYYM